MLFIFWLLHYSIYWCVSAAAARVQLWTVCVLKRKTEPYSDTERYLVQTKDCCLSSSWPPFTSTHFVRVNGRHCPRYVWRETAMFVGLSLRTTFTVLGQRVLEFFTETYFYLIFKYSLWSVFTQIVSTQLEAWGPLPVRKSPKFGPWLGVINIINTIIMKWFKYLNQPMSFVLVLS